VRAGAIRRAAQGVYVCRHADAPQLAAARLHARVDCVSALRRAGVWSGFDDRLHLHVGSHATGVRASGVPVARAEPLSLEQLLSRRSGGGEHDAELRVAMHRGRLSYPAASASLVSPRDALLHSMRCLDDENVIAALESAVREGFITMAGLADVCARAPGRLGAAISEIELTSHSGYETIVRVRLRRAGFAVVAQGYIPGVGHQDLVVEDLVGIETDGQFWHNTSEQFRVDHDRDVRSAALGRGVIRLSESEIFLHWETSLLAIERAVADARDLRRFRGRP
jgi:very-short-patch-repair endonuclease